MSYFYKIILFRKQPFKDFSRLSSFPESELDYSRFAPARVSSSSSNCCCPRCPRSGSAASPPPPPRAHFLRLSPAAFPAVPLIPCSCYKHTNRNVSRSMRSLQLDKITLSISTIPSLSTSEFLSAIIALITISTTAAEQ